MRVLFTASLVLALAGAAFAAVAARGSSTASVLKVKETEYHLALSSTSLKAGTYTVSVHNAGKILHKLDLAGGGLKTTVRLPGIAPGATRSVTVKLTGGTLTLWCPVPGHAALGMKTSLKVAGKASGSAWG